MKKVSLFSTVVIMTTIIAAQVSAAAPEHFREAKQIAKEKIYYDQNQRGSFYCGCTYKFLGRSGGRMNLASCRYSVRKNQHRAERLEWEHIVPASNFGRARQCWQQGGRKNCSRHDPVFARMEADLFNLAPAIGEVNGDRSNYNFGPVKQKNQYGACPFAVDFKHRIAEPGDLIKGMVARTYFYMFDRYHLQMSNKQAKILMAWHRSHPVNAWEAERDKRIANIMGWHNPYVTGKKTWQQKKQSKRKLLQQEAVANTVPVVVVEMVVHGNKKSKLYHLAECPSYDRISAKNLVKFDTEEQAQNAGYQRARNCKTEQK